MTDPTPTTGSPTTGSPASGTRRRFLGAASLALGAAVAVGCSRAADPVIHGEHGLTEDTAGMSPDQALATLKDGNARFVAMTEAEPNVSSERLMAVSKGQQPFVGVLGCVDSRVPPELVFDRGLGDIFDARIAGAVADDAAIGSLEFGVEEFDVPLLVVLGHSQCGAIKAAVDAAEPGTPDLPGRIGAVVDPIVPTVTAARNRGLAGAELVAAVVVDVVGRGVAALTASPVLAPRLRSGVLKIVGAYYDLQTGQVTFLESAGSQSTPR